MQRSNHTAKIVMTALMMGIIMVATMFIRIPIPNGYVHLGDSMIFIAVLVLGWKLGAVAAAFGAMFADLLSFPAYAPWTFAIKALMAIVMGLLIQKAAKKDGMSILKLMGMVLDGIVMVVGYYLAERVMLGSWIAPLADIPFNIGQFIVGMIVASILAAALYRTTARKYFTY